jgi:hypothetical protein
VSEREGGVAQRLIDALEQGAALVDDGGFTLDPSKAREKLRAYQLADPHAYLLLMVEAAWIAGQRDINISCGATSVAEFVGLPLSRSELENVFTSVFASTGELRGEALARARIQQLLGVAANAALSLEPRQIELECADSRGRLNRMTVDVDGRFACEAVCEAPPGRTRLAFHGRPGTARERLEVELIQARCRYASFTVNLYGRQISQGPRWALLGVRTDRIRLDGRPVGLAGIHPEHEPAKLLLVTRGVLAETITLDGGVRGFVAVVDVDLRKDLSQQGVLRGEAFDELMRTVARAHRQLTRRELELD